jgi:hypothetical protein
LVEELLRQLARAVKTRQLYLPNNPIYQRSVEQLQAAFAPLWEQTSEVVLQISETEFRWSGVVVHQESTGGESLPWTCYKDGLRELTLLQGVEEEEITVFLDILQRVRKSSPDEDDLLTLLWEQEFELLRYRFVDLGIDTSMVLEPSEESSKEKRIPIVEITSEAEAEQDAPKEGIIRMEDLDATLYFLDEEEIQYLRSEVLKEQASNLHRNVTAILLDIFELEGSDAVRDEVCGIFESYVPQLLMARDHGTAAYLLREVADLARMESLRPIDRERLARLPESLSAPGVLAQLLQVLEDGDAAASQEDLVALFQELRGGTLGAVLGWLGSGRASNPAVRTALEGAAKRLAAANTGALVALITSEEPGTALEAIRRAGELRTPVAVAPLARVMAGHLPELRRVAAQALAQIGSPGAMRVLEGVLDDADRDIRITAVRAVGVHGYRAALPKVEAVVTGKAVRDADLTEKMACFETFGLLARDEGVEQLAALLSGRSLVLRRRIDPELRACAAMALGKIGTPRALAALRGAIEDKDVRVRSAINRAMREAGQ